MRTEWTRKLGDKQALVMATFSHYVGPPTAIQYDWPDAFWKGIGVIVCTRGYAHWLAERFGLKVRLTYLRGL